MINYYNSIIKSKGERKMKSKEHNRLLRERRKCFDKNWNCLDRDRVDEIDRLMRIEDERFNAVIQKFMDNIQPMEFPKVSIGGNK